VKRETVVGYTLYEEEVFRNRESWLGQVGSLGRSSQDMMQEMLCGVNMDPNADIEFDDDLPEDSDYKIEYKFEEIEINEDAEANKALGLTEDQEILSDDVVEGAKVAKIAYIPRKYAYLVVFMLIAFMIVAFGGMYYLITQDLSKGHNIKNNGGDDTGKKRDRLAVEAAQAKNKDIVSFFNANRHYNRRLNDLIDGEFGFEYERDDGSHDHFENEVAKRVLSASEDDDETKSGFAKWASANKHYAAQANHAARADSDDFVKFEMQLSILDRNPILDHFFLGDMDDERKKRFETICLAKNRYLEPSKNLKEEADVVLSPDAKESDKLDKVGPDCVRLARLREDFFSGLFKFLYLDVVYKKLMVDKNGPIEVDASNAPLATRAGCKIFWEQMAFKCPSLRRLQIIIAACKMGSLEQVFSSNC